MSTVSTAAGMQLVQLLQALDVGQRDPKGGLATTQTATPYFGCKDPLLLEMCETSPEAWAWAVPSGAVPVRWRMG